jgi:VanZ family protein
VTPPFESPARSRSTGARAVNLWGPVAAYCVLIFMLSSSSDLPSLPGGLSDKIAHMLLYSGLGFLVARAVAGGVGRPLPGWTVALAVVASLAYGFTDETHQLFVPRRQFDPLDLAADGIGA